MLATSTQHCTGGFSWCSKARKQERKSIQIGKEEEKGLTFVELRNPNA